MKSDRCASAFSRLGRGPSRLIGEERWRDFLSSHHRCPPALSLRPSEFEELALSRRSAAMAEGLGAGSHLDALLRGLVSADIADRRIFAARRPCCRRDLVLWLNGPEMERERAQKRFMDGEHFTCLLPGPGFSCVSQGYWCSFTASVLERAAAFVQSPRDDGRI